MKHKAKSKLIVIDKIFYLIAILIMIFFFKSAALAQQKFTINGTIKDSSSGEELIGANALIQGTQTGAVADVTGSYSLTLPQGNYQIQFSFIGYKSQTISVDLNQNTILNIQLQSEETQLQEIVVINKDSDVSNSIMSKSKLNMGLVRKNPGAFGEVDIIKSIQTMPGVISAGEGTSSFFVRGGSADQNLILMDGAPVYDPSHLFGLYSVFNADVIKEAELYKGAIPSRLGGRLSSVLEVNTKDGNKEKLSTSGGIGVLATRLMIDGPLVKDKSSFLISARRSYLDLFLKAAQQKTTASFADVNVKFNWRTNPKNNFSAALYGGSDNFILDRKFDFGWSNTIGSIRWKHLFNEKLILTTSATLSKFNYKLDFKDKTEGFIWQSGLQQAALNNDFTYFINPNNELSFGYQVSLKEFRPGKISSPPGTNLPMNVELEKAYAIDHVLYLDNQQSINNKLSLGYGVRLSIFQNVGKSDIIVYDNPSDNTHIVRKDTIHYGDFQNIKTFVNWEPRLSVSYLLTENSSVKTSYNHMVQNVHSISNGMVSLPFNTWLPSGYYLKPQIADQFAIGYFHHLKESSIELSAEAFYKNMKDVTDFADNANLFFNRDLVTEIRQGKSWSYGAEFTAQKKEGKFSGIVSYTLSKAMRQISGVNNGNPYAANHDRRHVVNFTGSYDLNSKWSFGANFTYSTGRPITLSSGRYEFGSYNVDVVTERNSYRLPDFHRLDVAVTFNPQKHKERKWKGQWIFSVYNVYGRKNPFTMYTRVAQDENGKTIGDGSIKEARLISLFPIIPSITYNFKF